MAKVIRCRKGARDCDSPRNVRAALCAIREPPRSSPAPGGDQSRAAMNSSAQRRIREFAVSLPDA
jgi:hypothetical protein